MNIGYPGFPDGVDYSVITDQPGVISTAKIIPIVGWRWWALISGSIIAAPAGAGSIFTVGVLSDVALVAFGVAGSNSTIATSVLFGFGVQASNAIASGLRGFVGIPFAPVRGDGLVTFGFSPPNVADNFSNISLVVIGQLNQ